MATRPIDEKIVAMKMDNSDLVRKAAETTTIFGKLRNALSKIPGINLDKSTQELSKIQKAADRTDLSGLQNSVDKVGSGFTKLEIMATTALVNITNRAVNAGIQLSRSLGPEQVADGFREYEMKIGSIGTMLANTEWAGTGLDEVKKTLSELNEYADQTIYSFSQMTQNIGRFTAAGVTLGDSTIAIKGLGNLAAISGSTSEQLNTAMYQMSQALSAGRLTLMDWNSMVNAGMGGKKTQDALLETAKAMGVAVDMSEGFRNSIQDGWLTSEVLLETLKKFGADESMTEAATKVRTFTQMMATLKEGIGSGWAETWELIFGDFEEATLLWSTLSEIIKRPFDAMAKSRNDFLRAIIDGGVIQNVVSGIANTIKPIGDLFRAIGDGFRLAFPPISIDTITSLARSFAEFARGLLMSETTLAAVTKVSYGVFAIFSSVWEIVKSLTQAVFALLPSFKEVGVLILGALAGIANLSISFNTSIKSGELFANVMEIIGKGVEYAGKGLEWLTDKLKIAGRFMGMSFEGDSISETNKELITMRDILTPIADFFRGMFDTVVTGFNWVKEKLAGFAQVIKDALPNGNQLFAGGFIAALATIVGFTMKVAWDLYEVFTGWGKIGTGVTDVLDSVSWALKGFTASVAANAILTIAIAVGVLAGGLHILAKIPKDRVTDVLISLTTILTGLVGALAIMTKFDITGTGMRSSLTMIGMGMAVMVMAGALKKLSDMDTGEILRGILGLVGIMGALSGAIVLMSTFGGAKVGASALQILALATSVHILISAIKRISEIDTGALVKGVSTMGIILIQMGLFFKIAGKSTFGIGSTLGMLAIGQAIINITKAINEIAKIDVKNLIVGLTTIGLILGAIAAFARLTSDKGLLSAGLGMIFLATALTALVLPISLLGGMELEALAKGIGSIAVVLLAVGAASLMMKNMLATGAGLILVAGALHMFIVPIAALSAMSWEAILKGIGGLALGLVTIGGVSALLGMAAGYIAAFGGALAIVGVAMLAAGAGMALFSTGLVTLATMTSASVMTIVATFGTLLVGLASILPTAVDFVVKLFMQIMSAIGRETPKLVGIIVGAIVKVLQVIADYIPAFVSAAVKIITNFLDAIAKHLPDIIMSAVNLMVAFVEGLAAAVELKGPEFLDAIMRLMSEVAVIIVKAGAAVVEALFGWIPGVKDATDKISESAVDAIREAFDVETTGKDKGDELIEGMKSKSDGVKDAGVTIAEAGKDGMESIDVTSSGEEFGAGFANGIDSGANREKVSGAARNLANIATGELRNTLDIHSPSRVTTMLGSDTGSGFANGIASSEKKVSGSANSIAGAVMEALGIKSPATKSASKGGKETSNQFAKGISSNKSKVTSSARAVGKSVRETLEEQRKKEFEASKAWIDERKYYNQMTLEQELKAWERLQARYKKGTEERKEADREVYRLKNELIKAEFENSKKWIDDRKYYNEMALTSELKAWERIQARYKEGTEQRKEADREVYRLKNEINQKLIDLNDEYTSKVQESNKKLLDEERRLNDEYKAAVRDENERHNAESVRLREEYERNYTDTIERSRAEELRLREEYQKSVEDINQKLIDDEKRLNDEYAKALKDRTSELTNFTGLFDKVETKNVKGQTLLDNLKGQVDTFVNWSDNLKNLSARGLDEGLLAELREMGPKAAGEIAALNSLTDKQLSEYTDLWKAKNELAHTEALNELEGLREDTAAQIETLKSDTAKQLDELKDTWVSNTQKLNEETSAELNKLTNDWRDKTNQLKAESERKIAELKDNLVKETKRLTEETRAELESYKTEWLEKIEELSRGTKDKFVPLKKSLKDIGADTIRGLQDGMESMEGPLLKEAKSIADQVARTIRKALDVHSPSRVTKTIGQFVTEGIAVGMVDKLNTVTSSAKKVAATAKDSLNNFLNGFELPDDENELHFKAVIDYESFDPSKFGSLESLRIKPDTSFTISSIEASRAAKRQNDNNSNNNQSRQSREQKSDTKPAVIEQNLNFYSKQLTPSEVARKNLQASRQLAMQWGV
jgi:tape measure domain-containing protein